MTILPWNDDDVAASPFVAAFTEMGIPYADHIMNAVVLTAVLSCLNSGMYTASRMLFVLAARREAPASTGHGEPARRADDRDPVVVGRRLPVRDRRGGLAGHRLRVPAELQRRDHPVRLPAHRHLADRAAVPTPESTLKVKMWLFPVLSVLTALGIVARPGADGPHRGRAVAAGAEPASWAVVLVLFFVNRARIARLPARVVNEPTGEAHRVLVLANQTLEADELIERAATHRLDGQGDVLRLRPGQRRRDRHRLHSRRRVRAGRHDPGRAGAVGPDARGPPRRTTSTPPADSVTSDRCGRCGRR